MVGIGVLAGVVLVREVALWYSVAGSRVMMGWVMCSRLTVEYLWELCRVVSGGQFCSALVKKLAALPLSL